MQRRRKLMAMQSELPSAYRRVEWIENTGPSYIDTGLTIDLGYTCETDICWTSITRRQLMGASQVGYWGINIESLYETYTPSNYAAQLGRWDNVVFRVTYDGRYSHRYLNVNRNETLTDLQSTTIPSGNIYIFKISTGFSCYAKIKSQKIWNASGTLLSHFIPCVRKSDSKPGMYDTVSKTFYINAGTGNFIVPT